MSRPGDPLAKTMARLRLALALTWAGLVAERVARAFWPLLSLLALAAGAVFLGLHEHASPVGFRVVVAGLALAALALGLRGLVRLRWPRRADAVNRLDASLAGRPLAALGDAQAVGADDDASAALWQAHQSRMATRAAGARHVPPDLRLARFDPYGLRHVALLVLVIGLVFGSVWRAGTVAQMGPGSSGAALAQGPAWEGWIEPPRHTGLPSLYLADQEGVIRASAGSEVTLRFYGAEGALSLHETTSGRDAADQPSAPEQSFDITRDGVLRIEGPGGRAWQVQAVADAAPRVAVHDAEARTSFEGQMSQPFEARDDYGVTGGHAIITLDEA